MSLSTVDFSDDFPQRRRLKHRNTSGGRHHHDRCWTNRPQLVSEFGDGPLRTAEVFALAKRSIDMDLDQIEELLEHPDPGFGWGGECHDFQADAVPRRPRVGETSTSCTCVGTTESTLVDGRPSRRHGSWAAT
jgi:hypothetical protein